MPTESSARLAELSKKSVQVVEKMYNDTMEQEKKTSPTYKQYENENNKKNAKGETQNPKKSQEIYTKFMGEFMIKLKQKLGIKKETAIESVIRESVFMKGYKKGKRSANIRHEKDKGYIVTFKDSEAGVDETKTYADEKIADRSAKNFINKIEEEVAGITTASMGSPTTASGEPARFGSSAIYADRMSMTSRGGQVGMPKPLKKKKKIRESIEYIDKLMAETLLEGFDDPYDFERRELIVKIHDAEEELKEAQTNISLPHEKIIKFREKFMTIFQMNEIKRKEKIETLKNRIENLNKELKHILSVQNQLKEKL